MLFKLLLFTILLSSSFVILLLILPTKNLSLLLNNLQYVYIIKLHLMIYFIHYHLLIIKAPQTFARLSILSISYLIVIFVILILCINLSEVFIPDNTVIIIILAVLSIKLRYHSIFIFLFISIFN